MLVHVLLLNQVQKLLLRRVRSHIAVALKCPAELGASLHLAAVFDDVLVLTQQGRLHGGLLGHDLGHQRGCLLSGVAAGWGQHITHRNVLLGLRHLLFGRVVVAIGIGALGERDFFNLKRDPRRLAFSRAQVRT